MALSQAFAVRLILVTYQTNGLEYTFRPGPGDPKKIDRSEIKKKNCLIGRDYFVGYSTRRTKSLPPPLRVSTSLGL